MALLQDFESFNNQGFTSGRDSSAPSVENLLNEITDTSQIKKENPIFDIADVECKPVTSQGLVDMVVCNNIICIALGNLHILRLNLLQPGNLTTIPVTQHQQNEQIHKIFMDPSGTHVIISMSTANNWYLHGTWKKKLYYLKDMKGIIVESVAWDKKSADIETTKQILIGAANGTIFETCIEIPQAQIAKCKQKIFRPVYNIGDDMKITGLAFERFPPTPGQPTKFLVMATTATRFYQFIGGPNFLSVFENTSIGFREFLGDRKDSIFRLYSHKPNGTAESFAWLTGPGISYGNLIFESQNKGDSVAQDMELFLFPEDHMARNIKQSTAPISIIITDFHWLVLYYDKIQAINKLNEEITWEERFRANQNIGEIRGITNDPIAGTIWIYATNQVFEITVNDEDRDIWKLYLEKSNYSKALHFCKTAKQKDIVWSAQAENAFEQRNYGDAATFFGKTALSFEEVSLKFIRMNNRDALKTYLLQKLQNFSQTDVTQRTLLCTWLVELYLDKLNKLTNDRDKSTYQLLQSEFQQFLSQNSNSLNKTTTYNLISSHGRIEELLFFAIQAGDFELVINHYLRERQYLQALKVLHMPAQKNEELFYNTIPVLMAQIPYETVNELLKAGNKLDPRKIIPALMRYEKRKLPQGITENQPIRYLQQAIDVFQNEDKTVHNFLISLFARTPGYGQALKKFLHTDIYDREYALRVCSKENQTEACIIIYSAMGEYEEAVELSLQVDIDLAKEQVYKVHNDDERRKKLWLRMARHVVEKEENIQEAMAFLSQADNLLKIEDILPFFPQFTLIDEFKDEICKALKEYNEKIEDLKRDMDEATRSAVLIRRDIKNLRNKYGFVSQNQLCDICGYPVLTRLFYMFPCLHVYHGDCLTKEMVSHLNEEKKQRVQYLEFEIAREVPLKTVMDSVRENESSNAVTGMSEIDKNKTELDELIASECLLCGDVMINSITLPFYNPSDISLISSWNL